VITDSRITKSMSPFQLAGKIAADWQWELRDELGLGCTAVYKKGRDAGKRCLSKPGKGTDHEGWGPCVAHGGAKRPGRSTAAWLMAHKFAEELDVSPWEALLLVIRITAGRLRYIEQVLASANDDRELEGRVSPEEMMGVTEDGQVTTGRNLTWWVTKSEEERDRLAKVSKAAIDAGVAQLLIEKELRNGEELAGTFVKALEQMEKAGMTEEALEIARGVMRSQLQLALES
jgi:hypothetical protein